MRAFKQLLAAVAALAAVSLCPCIHANAQGQDSTKTGVPRVEGIWKAVVPPTAMKSEFDGFDPIGIAAGAHIKADCSINWVNPDDGARYCFSSGTSLEFFLDNPHATIARARAAWRKLNGRSGD
jgi:hypothetical protein